jgi:hypothetical protein
MKMQNVTLFGYSEPLADASTILKRDSVFLLRKSLLALSLLGLSLAGTAQAQTYFWNVPGNGTWTTNGSWTTTGYPNAVGAVANFERTLSAQATISLGGGTITVGVVNLGGTGGAYFLNNGTLQMNNNGNGAQINELSTGYSDTIASPIVIADSGGLTITNSTDLGGSKGIVINGGISGTGNLLINNNSTDGNVSFGGSSLNNAGSITVEGASTGYFRPGTTIGTSVTDVSIGSVGNSLAGNVSLTGSSASGGSGTSSAGVNIANSGNFTVVTSGNVYLGEGSISNTGNDTFTLSGTGVVQFGSGNYNVSWNNTGAVTFNGTSSGSVQTATPGTGTTTFGSNVTNITFGSGGTANLANTIFNNSGNITITSNGTNIPTLSTVANSFNNSGTVTFNGTTSTTINPNTGIFGSNVTTLVQNDPNNTLIVNATGSGDPVLSDGVRILAGTFESNSNGYATGTANALIVLGSSSNNNSATLYLNSGVSTDTAFSNLIDVGTSAGTLSINNHNTSKTNLNFSGLVTLSGNDTLTLAGYPVTLSGGVTGPGNILIAGGSNSTQTTYIFSTTSVNNGGTITNNTTGTTGTISITASVGSNVTGLTQSSATNPFNVTGGLAVNTGGTTLTNNATTPTTGLLTISNGAISGTGNLILANDTTLSNAIVVSAPLTYTGTLINSGTGSGSETVTALGANVTGVTQNSNTSAITASSASGAGNLALIQNGTALLTLTNGNNSGSITGSGSSTGTTVVGNLTSVTAVTQDSLGGGTMQINSANSTYANGVSILSGNVLLTNNVSAGSGAINVGDVGGSANTDLEANGGLTIANEINVGASSGTMEVSNAGTTGTTTYSGPVTLNGGTLTVAANGTGAGTVISSGISGTGNVVLLSNSSTASVTLSNDVANVGTVANSGVGTSTTLISADVEDTVTGITENSSTSALTLSGNFLEDDANGITLTNNAASGSTGILTVADGIDGTATITLDNNSAITNGIALTPSGTAAFGIVNSGTGSGSETIGFALGGSQGVTENSTTSALYLTGTNTYAGATTVTTGTLFVSGSTSASSVVSVNGGVLNDTGNVKGAIHVASGATLSGSGNGTTTGLMGALTINGGGIINTQDMGIGKLAGSTLTLNTGGGNAILDLDISSGGTADLLTFSGLATLNNDFTVNVDALSGAAPGTYTIVTANGGGLSASDFMAGTLTGLSGDSMSFSLSGNSIILTIGGAESTSYYFTGATSSDFTLAGNYNDSISGGNVHTTGPLATSDVFLDATTSTNTPATLNAASTINTLTYDSPASTLAGSGTLTLMGSAGITDNAAGGTTETIDPQVALGASQGWTVSTSSNTLVVAGGVTGTSGQLLTLSGPGSYNFTSGSSSGAYSTTVASGAKVFVTNPTGSAFGTGALIVHQGATFGGNGMVTGMTSFALGSGGSGGPTQVQVGSGGSDTSTSLTLEATGASTINNTNLTFNLSSSTLGQANQLALGATPVSFQLGDTTLTLNVTGSSIITPGTTYVLITDSAGFAGLNVAQGQDGIITSGLSIAGNAFFGSSAANGFTTGFYANSFLAVTDNGTEIEVEVVPEPSTWAMMLGGLALLVFWQRRKGKIS